MNLKLVEQRDNFFGETIVRNYEKDPAETLRMIRDQFKDNPEAVTKTISRENVIALGLLNPLEKFQYYFPVKECSKGLHGLVYKFKDLKELFQSLKRAKSMIRDFGWELDARSISRGTDHILYIDQL